MGSGMAGAKGVKDTVPPCSFPSGLATFSGRFFPFYIKRATGSTAF